MLPEQEMLAANYQTLVTGFEMAARHLHDLKQNRRTNDLDKSYKVMFPAHYKDKRGLKIAHGFQRAKNNAHIRENLVDLAEEETNFAHLTTAAESTLEEWSHNPISRLVSQDRKDMALRDEFLKERIDFEGAFASPFTNIFGHDPLSHFKERITQQGNMAIRYYDMRKIYTGGLATHYQNDAYHQLLRLDVDIAAYAGLEERNTAALDDMQTQLDTARLSFVFAQALYPEMAPGVPAPRVEGSVEGSKKPRTNALGIPLIPPKMS